jgi:ERCC4-type nuclease
MAKLVVHIDFREKELYEVLKGRAAELPFGIASQNLEVGDVMIGLESGQPLLVMERKTLSDLASSNRDGRYREQRARLLSVKGQGVAIAYIMEIGSGWSNELNRIWPGKVIETTLYSIVLRLQLRYGISVLQVKDTAGTIALIGQLCKMLQEDNEVFSQAGGIVGDATAAAAVYTEALSAQKSANRNMKRPAAGMLCAVAGVGGKMSESILDACEGTLEGVMKKSEVELAAVSLGKRTVGKVLAKTLWSALHSKI